MPIDECDHCGSDYRWSWTEAFDKFGFMDGDGQVETRQVEDVLTEAGYEVTVLDWGFHNTIITSIKRDGIEQIPHDRIRLGYDDAREYLPCEIVALLDLHLPD